MTPEEAKKRREEVIRFELPEFISFHQKQIDAALIKDGKAYVPFSPYVDSVSKKIALINALKEQYEPKGWILSWCSSEWGDHIEVISKEYAQKQSKNVLIMVSVIFCLIAVVIYAITSS